MAKSLYRLFQVSNLPWLAMQCTFLNHITLTEVIETLRGKPFSKAKQNECQVDYLMNGYAIQRFFFLRNSASINGFILSIHT